MSKQYPWFAASLFLCLACHRGDQPAPVEPKAPPELPVEATPVATAAEQPGAGAQPTAVASEPDCSSAAIERSDASWRDGVACLDRLTPKCEQGDGVSCMDAGTILVNGLGGAPKDPARALGLASSACERKNTGACLMVAVMHERGIGVPADSAKADVFIARACELGDPRGCELKAQRAPKSPAFIANANLSVESIAADGLEVRDLMCEVTGGMPMLGAMIIVGTMAKQKRALDKCAPAGQAFAVTWTFAGGKAREVAATGGTAAANACVSKAIARTAATLDGRCGAIVLAGKEAGANESLAALRAGGPAAK